MYGDGLWAKKGNDSPLILYLVLPLILFYAVMQEFSKNNTQKQVNHQTMFPKVDAMKTYIFASVLQQ